MTDTHDLILPLHGYTHEDDSNYIEDDDDDDDIECHVLILSPVRKEKGKIRFLNKNCRRVMI